MAKKSQSNSITDRSKRRSRPKISSPPVSGQSDSTSQAEWANELGPPRSLSIGTKLKRHGLSSMFPKMSSSQRETLKTSLRTHGQRVPIVLLDELILDGGGRYDALADLGMPLRVANYIGGDPRGFTFAQNFCRRSLTQGQGLMVAAKMTTLKPGEKSKPGAKETNLSISLEEAAEWTGFSISTIKTAKKVVESKRQDIIQAVESEKISIDLASKLIGLTEEQVRQVLESENPKKEINKVLGGSEGDGIGATRNSRSRRQQNANEDKQSEETQVQNNLVEEDESDMAEGDELSADEPFAENFLADDEEDVDDEDTAETMFDWFKKSYYRLSDDDRQRLSDLVYDFFYEEKLWGPAGDGDMTDSELASEDIDDSEDEEVVEFPEEEEDYSDLDVGEEDDDDYVDDSDGVEEEWDEN